MDRSRGDGGDHGRVDHIQTVETVKFQIGAHDAAGRGTHAAGPDRMVMSHDRALDERFKIRVAAAIDAGIDLLRTPFRQRGLMSDHASRIECLPNEPAVMLGAQIRRIDDGSIVESGAAEAEPATAGRVGHSGQNRIRGTTRRTLETLGHGGGRDTAQYDIGNTVRAGQVAGIQVGQGLGVLQPRWRHGLLGAVDIPGRQ